MMNSPSPKILLIDDDPLFLLGTEFLLSQYGYIVQVSENAQEAYKLLKASTPDLIVCDIMMPKMNGFEFREKLSEDSQTRDIPFIFLTARSQSEDMLHGFDVGADDYVTKPFDRAEFLARIKAVLRREAKSRQAAEKKMSRLMEDFQTEVLKNTRHELYTPLNNIFLSLDTILEKRYRSVKERQEFLQNVMSGAQQLKFLIDDLIKLTYIDQNRLEIFRQQIKLRYDFYEPIKKRIEYHKYYKKHISVSYKVEEDLEIYAPRKDFTHAVIHLVDNALKFSPENGSIVIKLSGRGEGGCTVTVMDQGPGIPTDQREKVFQRYYQISQGDARYYEGLGVGLTIARAIARSLGGDVIILPTSEGCKVEMIIPPLEHQT